MMRKHVSNIAWGSGFQPHREMEKNEEEEVDEEEENKNDCLFCRDEGSEVPRSMCRLLPQWSWKPGELCMR